MKCNYMSESDDMPWACLHIKYIRNVTSSIYEFDHNYLQLSRRLPPATFTEIQDVFSPFSKSKTTQATA